MKFNLSRNKFVIEDIAMNQKDLISIVECPVCLRIPRDIHVYACPNSHSICGECQPQISSKRCPTCNVLYDVPPRRNRALEEIIARGNLSFFCKHAGCQQTGKRDVLAKHEKSCQFRSVVCFRDTCNAKIKISEFVVHMVDQHKYLDMGISKGQGMRLNCLIRKNMAHKYWPGIIHTINGADFFLNLVKGPDALFYPWIFSVASRSILPKYTASIEIEQNGARIVFPSKVFGVGNSLKEVYANSVGLTESQARMLLSKNEHSATKADYAHKLVIFYSVTQA